LTNIKNDTSYLRIRLQNAEKTGFEQSNFEQMIMTHSAQTEKNKKLKHKFLVFTVQQFKAIYDT
jgi:hypothetical protein